MIVYKELEAIFMDHCQVGFNVLEIGAEPQGYLSNLNNVELISTNIKNIKGISCVADAQKLPFKNNHFDLIFMVAVDYYIPNVELSFSEVYRVLKPNGFFINATYNEVILKKQMRIDPFALRAFSKTNHLNLYKNIGFKTSLSRIANNPPTFFIKRLAWKFIPRFFKVALSSWVVFVNKKI